MNTLHLQVDEYHIKPVVGRQVERLCFNCKCVISFLLLITPIISSIISTGVRRSGDVVISDE